MVSPVPLTPHTENPIMQHTFTPLTIRDTTLRNRIGLAPMSMYDATDGHPGRFETAHLGARAAGGAGLVLTGTVAVSPEGRITPRDPGLWHDDHVASLAAVADTIRASGSVPGIQLGHAGRKASTTVPWRGGPPGRDGRSLTEAEGAWPTVAPSPLPYGGDKNQQPAPLDARGLEQVRQKFVEATLRADRAGFEVLELHAAHGYLLHSFYSPKANRREDDWGGSFERRIRFPLEVIDAVRQAWPSRRPLMLRMTMEDFHPDGLTLEEGLALARRAVERGVDVIDPMSFGTVAPGGVLPDEDFTLRHLRALRHAVPDAVLAASARTSPDLETDPHAIEAQLERGDLDLVLLGRQLLVDPHWPARAAVTLGAASAVLPPAYQHWLPSASSARGDRARA